MIERCDLFVKLELLQPLLSTTTPRIENTKQDTIHDWIIIRDGFDCGNVEVWI